jgi:hypothetical protein
MVDKKPSAHVAELLQQAFAGIKLSADLNASKLNDIRRIVDVGTITQVPEEFLNDYCRSTFVTDELHAISSLITSSDPFGRNFSAYHREGAASDMFMRNL